MSVLTGCNNTSGAGHNERELRIALINPIDGMHNTVSQGIDSYFNATYIDQKTGQQVDVTEQVTWASSNPNTRIMNNGTLITQESATQSTVSASYLDAYESNRIEVAIIAPDNETLSFRVQPGVYHVNEQETLQYRAFVEFSYQGRVAHQDVTHGTRWSHNVTDGDNHVVICNIGSIEPECEGQQSGFTSTDLGEAVVEVIAEHPLITNQLLNQSNEWLFISENAPFLISPLQSTTQTTLSSTRNKPLRLSRVCIWLRKRALRT
ncbi:hypothetical protein JCM19233_303 [Vibrio astriarenae]|nr:hypothetical protein JCM19233_303 [Vibrio sp. C7]